MNNQLITNILLNQIELRAQMKVTDERIKRGNSGEIRGYRGGSLHTGSNYVGEFLYQELDVVG